MLLFWDRQSRYTCDGCVPCIPLRRFHRVVMIMFNMRTKSVLGLVKPGDVSTMASTTLDGWIACSPQQPRTIRVLLVVLTSANLIGWQTLRRVAKVTSRVFCWTWKFFGRAADQCSLSHLRCSYCHEGVLCSATKLCISVAVPVFMF